MKLSNLVLIFAAVTEARKVGVGSRWEKKQGFVAAKQEKTAEKAENKAAYKESKVEAKAENKQAAAQAKAESKAAYKEDKAEAKADKKQAAAQVKKESKVAAKQIQKSMRSLSVSAKPDGQRRQARKRLVLSRQDGRQENKAERLQNKDGMRAEARKDALAVKKSERAESTAERKDERNENRIAAINSRQEARAERGPRPEGERREVRLEKLAAVKAQYAAKRAARQKAIQLAKTWKPCDANNVVSNMPWGERKPGHMQVCMKQRGYDYDALRCMIYGMRADHVNEGCRNACDAILADYDNLNVDIAECAASKQ